MTLSPPMQARLQAARTRFPARWAELEELTARLPDPDLRRCLPALYALLDGRDQLSLPLELLADCAGASLAARQAVPWGSRVPEELFLRYVLPPRVNNEYPDRFRQQFGPELLRWLEAQPSGQNMLSAALAVNRWCGARVSYAPTDDRTLAPLAVLRRGKGRCGEESTLLVSALRAVCIPARQCYAPWWAHCDDNHAWVEFWADGSWHYTGACEPEPQPDTGWFTSAASRAMLVRSFAPDPVQGGWELINTTGRYGDTARLTVRVERDSRPCPGVPVRFQLVNYAQLKSLWEGHTDGAGCVSLEVGLGCLVLSACVGGRLLEQRADVRETRAVTLRWEDGFDPLTREGRVRWELTPPAERLPERPALWDETHLPEQPCEAGVPQPPSGLPPACARWVELAGKNGGEIARFCRLTCFSTEDKDLLLSTLTEKDLSDVTCAVLSDALAAALPRKGRFPLPVWRDQILAPRVEWEPLLPVRAALRRLLAGEPLHTARDVLDWMDTHLHPPEEYGRADRRGSAAGDQRHRACPPSEWELTAVEICRALGIPARLDPITHRFSAAGDSPSYSPVTLTLAAVEPELRYGEHATLARWDGTDYRVLEFGSLALSPETRLSLPPGAYRLITARRQIDGTVSARAIQFLLHTDRTIPLELEPDRTGRLLRCVTLPGVKGIPLSGGAPSPLCLPSHRGIVLLFLQPGREPTEHLLRELLDLSGAFRQGGWPIRMVLADPDQRENRTLQQVLQAIPAGTCLLCPRADRLALQRTMGLGDSRLPLALILDRGGRGVYGCANYQIRLARRLLTILNLL